MNRSAALWLVSCLAAMVLSATSAVVGQEADERPGGIVDDEPAAHVLYDEMMGALGRADSLCYEESCSWDFGSGRSASARYQVWLKKPNHFRVEQRAEGAATGVLVGDGRKLWIYWPDGEPPVGEESGLADVGSEKVYLTKPTPPGGHSILHEGAYIGAQMILDPSIFHGYTDSLQPYLDGVRFAGTGQADGQPCDLIELSFLHGQRSWKLWIAHQDRLPRRIDETVYLAETITRQERWSQVRLNEEIDQERFRWRRPMSWGRLDWPDPSASLLRSGRQAPDFELKCADGWKRRLSECGPVVWLVFWRFG